MASVHRSYCGTRFHLIIRPVSPYVILLTTTLLSTNMVTGGVVSMMLHLVRNMRSTKITTIVPLCSVHKNVSRCGVLVIYMVTYIYQYFV